MQIVILGAGGIGGYVGGRLVESGADVTFLVRPARKQHLDQKGLRIESPFGDFSARVRAVTPDDQPGSADVVLLTCKAYDLDDAIETIKPVVGENTVVLPLLNGMAHIDRLNQKFGRKRVFGGLAAMSVTLSADGVVRHFGEWRFVTFGEQDGSFSPRALALKALLNRTSLVVTLSDNVMQAMWEKAVFLTTFAGMTCLMRANVGEIARAPGGAALMRNFLEANAAIAGAEGFPIPEKFVAQNAAVLADKTSIGEASMLRDLERGGRVESDHILGWMLSRAEAHGLDTILHRAAYAHVKAYEQRREAGRVKAG
jgi:2-dehydropantoate 2-reductase